VLAGAPGSAKEPRATSGPPVAFDGDTVRLAGGLIVRLAGVDAPERGRPGAADATVLAQRAVDAGLAPQLLPGRDRYARSLGDLGQGATSLSRQLVAQGLAWVLDPADPLRAVQAEAVRQRRGVHAHDPPSAGPYLVSHSRFHNGDCRTIRAAGRRWPWSAQARPLLAAGLAPCRNCLRWPPVASGPRDPPPADR
jgi:micrococcal nuclease